jgi:hypothetical protein
MKIDDFFYRFTKETFQTIDDVFYTSFKILFLMQEEIARSSVPKIVTGLEDEYVSLLYPENVDLSSSNIIPVFCVNVKTMFGGNSSVAYNKKFGYLGFDPNNLRAKVCRKFDPWHIDYLTAKDREKLDSTVWHCLNKKS